MDSGLKPKVQITILARDKEKELPMFLKCVDNIDYDPKRLNIYIHTNNNSDRTADILEEWCEKNKDRFNTIDFIKEDIVELRDKPGRKTEDDWYAHGGIRLIKLGEIRQKSLEHAFDNKCDFYFVCDVDNFFPPETVSYCVEQNRPIISPMMVQLDGGFPRSFYHKCSSSGYWQENPVEKIIWNKVLKGIFEVELVHICYMIKTENISKGLSYHTNGVQMEFVTFSRSARYGRVKQFVTNEIQTLLDPSDDYDFNVRICRNMSYDLPWKIL